MWLWLWRRWRRRWRRRGRRGRIRNRSAGWCEKSRNKHMRLSAPSRSSPHILGLWLRWRRGRWHHRRSRFSPGLDWRLRSGWLRLGQYRRDRNITRIIPSRSTFFCLCRHPFFFFLFFLLGPQRRFPQLPPHILHVPLKLPPETFKLPHKFFKLLHQIHKLPLHPLKLASHIIHLLPKLRIFRHEPRFHIKQLASFHFHNIKLAPDVS